jgi:hypothetical protein
MCPGSAQFRTAILWFRQFVADAMLRERAVHEIKDLHDRIPSKPVEDGHR